MIDLVVTATSRVTGADADSARMGERFGRLDMASKLAVLAVESLGLDFDALPRERIGICLSARAGSLSTDLEYWKRRGAVGGPSPTLFAYTLPSAAVGEIAIRFRLTGPSLCLVGGEAAVVQEGGDLIRTGEAEGCLCVALNHVSVSAAELIRGPAESRASALFLTRGVRGLPGADIRFWP